MKIASFTGVIGDLASIYSFCLALIASTKLKHLHRNMRVF